MATPAKLKCNERYLKNLKRVWVPVELAEKLASGEYGETVNQSSTSILRILETFKEITSS